MKRLFLQASHQSEELLLDSLKMGKSLIKVLPIIIFFITGLFIQNINAQNLVTDGEVHQINYSGAYEDYTISSSTEYDQIEFYLNGGDGGRIKGGFSTIGRGGEGASVTVAFNIGTGYGELKPNGTIRVVIGQKGDGTTGASSDGGGGGGGTAILYKEQGAVHSCGTTPSLDISDADNCWVLLAVSGGGGGAYNNDGGKNKHGKGGNDIPDGGQGGNNGKAGGTDGTNGQSSEWGQGGGGYIETFIGGKLEGADPTNQYGCCEGGFGYGAGGYGYDAGGGGGGFSGGGTGSHVSSSHGYGGGGGGSYANPASEYANIIAGNKTKNPNSGKITYTYKASGTVRALCQDVDVELDATGTANVSLAQVDGGTFTNDGSSFTIMCLADETVNVFDCYPNMTFTCEDVGEVTISLIAVSPTGLDWCFSTVTIEDNILPEALCKDKMLTLDPTTGEATISVNDIDEGSSDNCNTVSLQLDKTLFTCADIGTNTVTLTVEDVDQTAATCPSTVTVVDGTAPNALCQNAIVALDNSGNGAVDAATINNTSTDVCGIQSMSLSQTNFECSHIGDNTVTLTVTDVNGNMGTCTATVMVEDNIAPSAVCQNQTFSLKYFEDDHTDFLGFHYEEPTLIESYSDNCNTENVGVISSWYVGSCDAVGVHYRTVVVEDDSGNTGSCVSTVTIIDDRAPDAYCKAIQVALDDQGKASITSDDVDNNSFDYCGIESYELDIDAFTCEDIGDNTVTMMVTDINDNTSTCSSTVTVVDGEAPTALCQGASVALDDSGNGTVDVAAINNSSTDACGIQSMSLSQTSFDCSHLGDNTVSLMVTDVNGNTSSCTATVAVEDNIAPSVVCQNQTFSLKYFENDHTDFLGFSYEEPTLIESYSDNCNSENVGVISSWYVGSCDAVGIHYRTVVVEDDSGNTGSCVSTVTIVDDRAPDAYCKAIQVALDDQGLASITTDDIDNNSFDYCGIASYELDKNAFTCDDLGTATVAMTVTDVNNNTNTCTATISVVEGGSLPGAFTTSDIGIASIGNDYKYSPCENPPTYKITSSGNNVMSSTTDNVAFASQSLCGNGSIIAKLESVTPNGYGGLMVRETTAAGAKQVALFSNMTNALRHEVRYSINGFKQVNSFMKPSSYWLKLERQGDWVFAYSSFDGSYFQYVHGVFVPMQNCVEIGMASFTYLPNTQTEAVFSNVSIVGSNSGFSGIDEHQNTEKPFLNPSTTPPNHRIDIFPNPTPSSFTLSFGQALEEPFKLRLYNAYGQLAEEQYIEAGSTQLEWNVSHLPSGVYWIIDIQNNIRRQLVIGR